MTLFSETRSNFHGALTGFLRSNEAVLLPLNLGRTYVRYKHSLREEADIDGLFLALKQILFFIASLK